MTINGRTRGLPLRLGQFSGLVLGVLLALVMLQTPAFGELQVDAAQGVVSDSSTGLMWQRYTGNDGKGLTWDEAVSYCKALTLAGYDDWRLPESKELESIIHHLSYNPVVDTRAFPDTASSGYWSATPYDVNPDYAWRIDFYYVGYVNVSRKSNLYFVRAVRTQP
ncbi:DUF1566 domain-containing protein [Desulfoluna sp.]|uniref:Lcl C-terminal domain-containing protein n=1 Tax=Desulfoluna sp. TaxID=2045199 RepID=UPI0026066865|nr:DUF1566 domain-containing protein [Desulfoluna sp.]